MRRILFVDDELNILAGLRRSLWNLRKQWDMVFAEGAAEALRQCAAAPFDAVVSDARMPGMEGSELLGEVMRQYPNTVRIVLSGQCSRESVLQCVGVAHQFLSKPCDAATLKSAIQRLCEIRDFFHDSGTRRAISCVQCLPSQRSHYQDLAAEMSSERATLGRVAEIVACDVAMSAKVLQLVSSGFFGSPQRVADATHAVTLLGLDTMRALWTSAHTFQPCSPGAHEAEVDALTEQSRAVAGMAKHIAQTLTEDRHLINDAYLSGMLHAVGTLALDSPSESPRGDEEPDPGGYLAALWGLPDTVVQAIAYQDIPHACPGQPSVPLTALHAARTLLARSANPASTLGGPSDTDHLQRAGDVPCLPDGVALREASQVERILP